MKRPRLVNPVRAFSDRLIRSGAHELSWVEVLTGVFWFLAGVCVIGLAGTLAVVILILLFTEPVVLMSALSVFAVAGALTWFARWHNRRVIEHKKLEMKLRQAEVLKAREEQNRRRQQEQNSEVRFYAGRFEA